MRAELACLASLLLLGGCGSGSGGPAEGQRPGVVLIIVDTLRADAILDPADTCATPGIDSLAADGVAFTRSFSHAPMTLPSHTALFSSRPPFETRVLNNWQTVRQDLPLLAEWLEEFGYDTRAVVSLGTLEAHSGQGLDRGFDDYDVDFWNMDEAPRVVERLRTTLDELDANRPFFLFAHFTDPHAPYNAHGTVERTAELLLDGELVETVKTTSLNHWWHDVELTAGRHVFEVRASHQIRIRALQCFRGKQKLDLTWEEGELMGACNQAVVAFEAEQAGTYQIRAWVNDSIGKKESQSRYVKEVEFVDGFIGQLVDELKRRGLYDSSLVIFTSDHGEALGERKVVGHVQNLHDEMLHVPLIVKPPAGPDSRRVTEALTRRSGSLVTHSDLVPTILELTGIPPLPDQRGVSLLVDKNRLLIAETHKPESKRSFVCLRDDRFKMILDPDEGTYTMFDLEADPREETDVFEARQSERPEWAGQLEAIARIVTQGGNLEDERDPETLERLKALGYL